MIPSNTARTPLLYGRDPGMDCYTYLAWTLWTLGYPDQALVAMRGR